jgi:hypothetical protein
MTTMMQTWLGNDWRNMESTYANLIKETIRQSVYMVHGISGIHFRQQIYPFPEPTHGPLTVLFELSAPPPAAIPYLLPSQHSMASCQVSRLKKHPIFKDELKDGTCTQPPPTPPYLQHHRLYFFTVFFTL